MPKKKAIRIIWEGKDQKIWGPDEVSQLNELLDLHPKVFTAQEIQKRPEILETVEIILGSWGMVKLDEEFLAMAPKLEAIFYAAGSVKTFVTEAMFDRGIRLTSAYMINAIPVSEYSLSAIVFSLKNGFRQMRKAWDEKTWVGQDDYPMPGVYRSKVGIISLGSIGSRVAELLKAFDVEVLAYDLAISDAQAEQLRVTPAKLETIFSECDVVSLHTAMVPATMGMIRGEHFAQMKPNSTFINTSRGPIVRHSEMLDVLRDRPDITAILDVTDPEPLPDGDPTYELPNVLITPHISGSMSNECRRMGQHSIDECRRYLKGEPLTSELKPQDIDKMA